MPDDTGKFVNRTYLFIRTHVLDNGSEPLPAALTCWESPDIVVIKPDGTRGSEAIANQVNHVEVTVANRGGVTAVGALVDVFYGDPATVLTPSTCTLIGSSTLTVQGHSTQPMAFPWQPSPNDVGHRCFLARVSLIIPPDSYRDGLLFDVRGDRHVAQRNLSVHTLAEHGRLDFKFRVANPEREGMLAKIVVEEVRDHNQRELLRRISGSECHQFTDRPLGKVMLLMEGVDEANELTVNLDPSQMRDVRLSVEAASNAVPGEVYAFRISQLRSTGEAVGGLTLFVRR